MVGITSRKNKERTLDSETHKRSTIWEPQNFALRAQKFFSPEDVHTLWNCCKDATVFCWIMKYKGTGTWKWRWGSSHHVVSLAMNKPWNTEEITKAVYNVREQMPASWWYDKAKVPILWGAPHSWCLSCNKAMYNHWKVQKKNRIIGNIVVIV